MERKIILEVQDRWGRIIRLVDDVWTDHILADHTPLSGNLPAVSDTLVNPDIVCFAANRIHTECYYRSAAIPAIPHRMLKVVVRFIIAEDGVGYVHTAFVTRNIRPREVLKWQRQLKS